MLRGAKVRTVSDQAQVKGHGQKPGHYPSSERGALGVRDSKSLEPRETCFPRHHVLATLGTKQP